MLGRLGLAPPRYTDGTAFFDHPPPVATPSATLSTTGGGKHGVTKRGPERLFSDSAPGIVPGSRFLRTLGARLTPDQWGYVLHLAWRVLRGEPQPGQLRPSRLLSTLGATSVLACPDKRGVLSDGTVSIKQLAFFQVWGCGEDGKGGQSKVVSGGLGDGNAFVRRDEGRDKNIHSVHGTLPRGSMNGMCRPFPLTDPSRPTLTHISALGAEGIVHQICPFVLF